MKNTEYTIEMVLTAFFIAALLILFGSILRGSLRPLKKMHFPACVIGGIIGIIIGPQVFGDDIGKMLGVKEEWKQIYYIWKEMPAFLISVVFASLMMGKSFPSMDKVWSNAAQHIVVGYAMAFMQYIMGILLVLFVLVPVFDANPLNSTLIAIGFQGGYGTAAGLSNVYTKFGFDTGYDMAIGMATAGKIAAIVVGIALINYAVRFNKMKCPDENRREFLKMAIPYDIAESEYKKQQEEQHLSADTLILHFALICMAILVGWFLREGFALIESPFISEGGYSGIVQYVPLFPMALIGGGVLQAIMGRMKWDKKVNAKHLHSISHSFLDLLIAVAIATISIEVIANHWKTLTLLILAGVFSNLFVFFLIAPYFYKSAPWIRGLGDFAHATGSTTTGLLLMKIIDPSDQTGARKGFNFKQPFYEPIVGGGVFTAISIHFSLRWACGIH